MMLENCGTLVVTDDRDLNLVQGLRRDVRHVERVDASEARVEEPEALDGAVLLGMDRVQAHEPVHDHLQRVLVGRRVHGALEVPERVGGHEVAVAGLHRVSVGPLEREAVVCDGTVLLEELEAGLHHRAHVLDGRRVRVNLLHGAVGHAPGTVDRIEARESDGGHNRSVVEPRHLLTVKIGVFEDDGRAEIADVERLPDRGAGHEACKVVHRDAHEARADVLLLGVVRRHDAEVRLLESLARVDVTAARLLDFLDALGD